MNPAILYSLTSDPEAKVLRLPVAGKCRGGGLLHLGSCHVAVPPLVVVEALLLATQITADRRETAEEERLAKDIEFATEGIDQLYELLLWVGGQPLVVSLRRERIIQELIEASSRELLREE